MVTIFKGSYLEAMYVKNLLEDCNIEVLTTNDVSTSEPWVVSAGGFRPVILKVGEDDYEIAKKAVGGYNSEKNDLEPIVPQ